MAGQPICAAWASSRSRTAGSAAGMSSMPSCRALKYSMGPPTSSGRAPRARISAARRSEEHTSELQSPCKPVCRLLLENNDGLRVGADVGLDGGDRVAVDEDVG